jgi:hypothetical protein
VCRAAALEFGTPLNEELLGLETQAMREEAEQLLQVRRSGCVMTAVQANSAHTRSAAAASASPVQDSTRCSNAPAAFAAYRAVSSQPGAFVFAADALWNAGGAALSHTATRTLLLTTF